MNLFKPKLGMSRAPSRSSVSLWHIHELFLGLHFGVRRSIPCMLPRSTGLPCISWRNCWFLMIISMASKHFLNQVLSKIALMILFDADRSVSLGLALVGYWNWLYDTNKWLPMVLPARSRSCSSKFMDVNDFNKVAPVLPISSGEDFKHTLQAAVYQPVTPFTGHPKSTLAILQWPWKVG